MCQWCLKDFVGLSYEITLAAYQNELIGIFSSIDLNFDVYCISILLVEKEIFWDCLNCRSNFPVIGLKQNREVQCNVFAEIDVCVILKNEEHPHLFQKKIRWWVVESFQKTTSQTRLTKLLFWKHYILKIALKKLLLFVK